MSTPNDESTQPPTDAWNAFLDLIETWHSDGPIKNTVAGETATLQREMRVMESCQ